jgi:3-oxoacyl-[acyl-carrier protein] reductase
MQLLGKVALVTGGGVGTGRAIALKLARRGCNVVVNYSKSKAEAEQTAEEIARGGSKGIAVQANVANDTSVRAMVKKTVAEFGRLDVLINNAGATSVIPHGDMEAVKEEDWDKIFLVNLRGPFYAIRAAAPHLAAGGQGVVINVSSVAGVVAMGSSVPYCASKAALNNMTVALARALAPQIRVNAVAPGFIDNTRWWKENPAYKMVKEFSVEHTPLHKVCQPDDVANVVCDIAASDLITGQVIVVDGGMTIFR